MVAARRCRRVLSMATAGALIAVVPTTPGTTATPRRPLTVDALVRLRDIGANGQVAPGTCPFSLSPDGKAAAMQVRQADPDKNSYALAMVTVDVATGRTATVDQGGELIRLTLALGGTFPLETGIPLAITPIWSGDGRWFAFLKRVNGSTQVWRADRDGRAARQVTHEPGDIAAFALAGGDRLAVVAGAASTGVATARLAEEALTGWRYDRRFSPTMTRLPRAAKDQVPPPVVVDLATGARRPATTSEAALASPPNTCPVPPQGSPGFTAQLRPVAGSVVERELVVTDHGRPTTCPVAVCRGRMLGPWLAGDARTLLFAQRVGFGASEIALYRWRTGERAPARLLRTGGELVNCSPAGAEAVCLLEEALRPRRLVAIGQHPGPPRTVFDPNPLWKTLALGRVLREHWTSADGAPVFGDVVLPLGFERGRRYPLVVVQYESRGFLRGGTGDEYPIQLLAANGFVVLSLQRPLPPGVDNPAGDIVTLERRSLAGFADRRRVLSAIERKVVDLVARGWVDPTRVGITGLSDGASTVQFAARNSRMFAAGIMSGCCWAPGQDALLGSIGADAYHLVGWPRLVDESRGFWRAMSIERHGAAFPILLQASDDEYLAAIPSFTALQQRGTPAELYVYPGEFHIKWQPAHRRAIYRRNLAWLRYWLQDVPPAEPDWLAQLSSWQRFRRAMPVDPGRGSAAGPLPVANPVLGVEQLEKPHVVR